MFPPFCAQGQTYIWTSPIFSNLEELLLRGMPRYLKEKKVNKFIKFPFVVLMAEAVSLAIQP